MRTLLRLFGIVSVWLGGTLLLFAVYEVYGTSRITDQHQTELAQEFRREVAGGPAAPGKRPRRGPPPIARILIPSIKVDEIVVEGTTMRELNYGPGRYRRTAKIGARGVAGVAGHRTGWGSPFIDLDRLDRGDEIVFETTEGRFTYRVTRSIVVGPSASWVLKGDPQSKAESRLVLTTCTPKYTSRNRLIIFADLVDKEAPRA